MMPQAALPGGAAETVRPIHVVSLATLFPSPAQPNFGLFVAESLKALARQPGICLTVIAPRGVPPWPLSRLPRYHAIAGLADEDMWQGLRVLRPRFALLPYVGGRVNPLMIAQAVRPALDALHRAQPVDVLDAQFFYPDGPAVHRLARALGLPFSIKARGADISYWPHQRGIGRQIMSAAAASAGLLAVSEAMKADMVALGMAADRISVHYTGIDMARFRILPDVRAARSGPPMLLTVGALIPRKGQDLVIRALPLLPGVHYQLAGSGEAEASYRALADELGVAERVHFLGPVANADLPALYNAADAFVLPSVSEGLANAWVEALACGTPIVVSAAGGAAELVRSEKAGYVVARTPQALAEAIGRLLAAPPVPATVAATLAGRFSWDRNGAELARHLRGMAL